MAHRILITGASGYLGGTLLSRWKSFGVPPYERLYALVRTEEQANAVKRYGAEPLRFDAKSEAAVREAVVGNRITVVFFLIDAFKSESQVYFIKALAEVKKVIGSGTEVHFLHVCATRHGDVAMLQSSHVRPPLTSLKTSGAKIFSSHAGAPTDRPLLDTEADLYNIQKSQRPPLLPPLQSASLLSESGGLGIGL